MSETKTSDCVEVRPDKVEVRNDTRLKKLELLNPEMKGDMMLEFRKSGMSDQTYYRLRNGITKGQPMHTKVLNDMVTALGLLEE